jgi:hypothetical protein
MAGLRISVFSSTEIQAVIAGMLNLPKTVTKDIRTQNKRVIPAIWSDVIGKAPATKIENASLVRTATTQIRDVNIILQAGGKGQLRKSVPPKGVEFGADPDVITTYPARSPKGTRYTERRHTQRQLPRPNPKGHVVYPAAADAIPRIASLWVQTTLRAFHELFKNGLGPGQ